jgi:Tol biopolymer transport system component
MLAIVAVIAATILLGDQVGVTLSSVGPLGTARSTSPIVIQFSETMNRDSVSERLQVEPGVRGDFSWSGSSMLFRPAQPLVPGKAYTVTLKRGATSQEGREVLSDYQFGFTVALPRVAWLAPADGAPQNIWMANQDGSDAKQVTFSPSGIYDFGVSPDGAQIAFAERNSNTGTSDLKLLDLATGGIRQLTNCVDADCTTPTWRPDGQLIAYERVDYNSDLNNVGTSPTRIWLIDLSSSPPTTRPLFSDLQILGYSAQWSDDGQRISVFNRDEGILVYDFKTDTTTAVPSMSGSSGALSDDGMRVVYPELQFTEDQQTRSYLKIADLTTQEIQPVTDPNEAVQDDRAEWRPGTNELAIARRYQDDRFTVGYQVYLLNLDNDQLTQLTDDPRYANAFFSWDPTGQQLLIQRFPQLDENGQTNSEGRPEIWVYDMKTKALTEVAVNVFHPRWVP